MSSHFFGYGGLRKIEHAVQDTVIAAPRGAPRRALACVVCIRLDSDKHRQRYEAVSIVVQDVGNVPAENPLGVL
jgi:hypothetical protein